MATNGVIHGIDRLLFPPPHFEDAVETLAQSDASIIGINTSQESEIDTGIYDTHTRIDLSTASKESIATTG